jgi:hypothetical protein
MTLLGWMFTVVYVTFLGSREIVNFKNGLDLVFT